MEVIHLVCTFKKLCTLKKKKCVFYRSTGRLCSSRLEGRLCLFGNSQTSSSSSSSMLTKKHEEAKVSTACSKAAQESLPCGDLTNSRHTRYCDLWPLPGVRCSDSRKRKWDGRVKQPLLGHRDSGSRRFFQPTAIFGCCVAHCSPRQIVSAHSRNVGHSRDDLFDWGRDQLFAFEGSREGGRGEIKGTFAAI